MADSKISALLALAQAGVVPGTDVVPIVNGGATKKVTPLDLVLASLGATTGTVGVNNGIALTTNSTYLYSKTSGGVSVRMMGINSGDTAYVGPIDTGPTSTVFNGSSTSASAAIYAGGSEKLYLASGLTRPGTDNAQTLGGPSYRWSTVYAATGTINTSDAREKTAVNELSSAELTAAKQIAKKIGSFRFLDAYSAKGDAARLHVGLTVQSVIEIIKDNGLDPMAYAFICYDEWEEQTIEHPAQYEMHDEIVDDQGNPLMVEIKAAWTEVLPSGSRYGFRSDELMLFIAKGFEARLAALEA
jgi:hypothetical protein